MRSAPDRPLRRANVLPPDALVFERPDGNLLVRSPHALGAYPDRLTDRLDRWFASRGHDTFLAERAPGGEWRRLTYHEACRQARGLAQAFLDRGLSADRPIAILSGNSLEHALVALGAFYAGVPYTPVAPAYSLVATEYTTLEHVLGSVTPGLIYVDDASLFARPLGSVDLSGAEIVAGISNIGALRTTPFAALAGTRETDDVSRRHAAVTPDAIAKILFTSGSTGKPKGVINTHRMLTANQEMIGAVMKFLADEPPVLCDWLPWNHTFGGNHNFGIALYNGGSLYIDAGRPTPAGFETTLRNLREIATTAYFNVPRGFDLLVPALRADARLRRHFFSRVNILFYAAAGLQQRIVDDMDALALDACGERIPWVTGLGATETAPFAVCTGAMDVPVAGRIGVPVPGVDLKIARVGQKWEARLRGPTVTPGYWRDARQTREAFDEEGFYKFGDAVGFVDERDPSKGFTIEGRLAEDFKLSTGTWVRVGPLRTRVLAALGDLAQDVVVTAPNQDFVGALIFPSPAVCRRLVPGAENSAPFASILARDEVRSRFRAALAAHAARDRTSSTTIARAILLDTPPSVNTGEITDKGSINQGAVLACRAAVVAELYASDLSARVIEIPEGDDHP